MKTSIGIALVLCALLGACATPKPPAPPSPVKLEAGARKRPAGIDCQRPESHVERQVCASPELLALETDVAAAFVLALRGEPLVSRPVLLALHTHWQRTRTARCAAAEGLGDQLIKETRHCLRDSYTRQLSLLRARAGEQPQPADAPHPLSAYVEFRLRDDQAPGLCASLGARFNAGLARAGQALPEARAAARGTGLPEVLRDDGGAYAGHALRARALLRDGRVLIDKGAVARWVGGLPNGGGRFNTFASSQTEDFADILLFTEGERHLALVLEPWGFYSPAPRGESAYAGVFELGAAQPQPLCLYQTYLTPPVANPLAQLPHSAALEAALAEMAGGLSLRLAPHERVSLTQIHHETRWTVLNMPRLLLAGAREPNRLAALRQLHNTMLEAIFQWSERSLESKRLYRQLLPRFVPAHEELVAHFIRNHELDAVQAGLAADLVLIILTAHAAESLDHADHGASPATAPTWPVAPAPGDLERGRKLGGLYSALLNGAPANAIEAFLRYEFATPERARGAAASGEPVLALSTGDVELTRQLLAGGADPRQGNAWGRTALHVAAAQGQTAVVKLLLAAGARADAATQEWDSDGAGGPDAAQSALVGRTPLMEAARGGDAEMLEAMLASAPSVDARDAQFLSACDFLAQNQGLEASARARIAPRLCAPRPVAPRTLAELIARGGRAVDATQLTRAVPGRRHQAEVPGGWLELRFGTEGRLGGSLRPRQGAQIPLAGHWRVSADGQLCVSPVLVFESFGKRVPLPARCSRFFELDGQRYVVAADAQDGDPVTAVPGP